MPELETGSVISGRYRVLKRLGRGGFGSVFLVEDTKLAAQYALKIPHEGMLDDDSLRRFRAEATTLDGLTHRHIVGFRGFVEAGDLVYYLLEYVDGPTLKSLLYPHGTIDDEGNPIRGRDLGRARVLARVREVLEALDYAHRRERSVVHRDIKPENVILEAPGTENETARVLDFGIARVIGSSRQTRTSAGFVGTGAYAAPEQAQGKKGEVDARTDVFAVGTMLYELLTGAIPFHAENELGAILQRRDYAEERGAPVPPLCEKAPEREFSARLEALVRKAQELSPARRFQSAREMVEAIDAIDAIDDEELRESGSPVGLLSKTARPSAASSASLDAGPSGWRWRSKALVPAALAGIIGIAVSVTGFPSDHGAKTTSLETSPSASAEGSHAIISRSSVGGAAAASLAAPADPVPAPATSTTAAPEPSTFASAAVSVSRTPRAAEPSPPERLGRSQPPPELTAADPEVRKAGEERLVAEARESPARTVTGTSLAAAPQVGHEGRSGGAAVGPPRLPTASATAVFGAPPPEAARGWAGEPLPARARRGGASPVIIYDSGKGLELELVYVPPGPFTMGSDDGEPDERPAHEHRVREGFYIGRFETTWREYEVFRNAVGREKPASPTWGSLPDHPVVNVSWDDASAYVEWVGLSLPTEAQFERAARGDDGRQYPWGSQWDPANLNYCDASSPADWPWRDAKGVDGFMYTAPVGSFPAGNSPCGASDMAGNVWEWCADAYDATIYPHYALGNFDAPTLENGAKVLRGGAWNFPRTHCTTHRRYRGEVKWRSYNIGIRTALAGSAAPTERKE